MQPLLQWPMGLSTLVKNNSRLGKRASKREERVLEDDINKCTKPENLQPFPTSVQAQSGFSLKPTPLNAALCIHSNGPEHNNVPE
jgi:hypothetical protein